MSKIDVSQWKEFKVRDLFIKISTKKLKYRTRDLPKIPDAVYNLPASTASVINQGLSVYVPKNGATILSKCLLVLANGDAGTVFYEPKPFTILQDSYALKLKQDINKYDISNVYLFLASVLTESFHYKFGWDNKAVWSRASDLTIKLPVTKDGQPNWQYMDEYIAKRAALAHKYVSELKSTKNHRKSLKISGWQEYKLSDLFTGCDCLIARGQRIKQRDRISGTIPLVTAGMENQGVADTIDDNGVNILYPADSITIDMFGNTFCHNEPFYADDNVLILHNSKYHYNELLFIAAVVNKTARQMSSYKSQFRMNSLNNLTIKLPAFSDGTPDWATMRKRVADLVALSHRDVTSLDPAELPIFVGDWQEFHLYDFFDIESGSKLDKRKAQLYEGPDFNLIGRSVDHNGIVGHCSTISGTKSYKKGCLTIPLGGRYLGACYVQCYVQLDDFYTTQNVDVLIPKFDMSDYVKKFISIVVFRESQLHYEAFVNELNRHIKTDFVIKLPVDLFGHPDWQYMNNYVEFMKSIADRHVGSFQSIIKK